MMMNVSFDRLDNVFSAVPFWEKKVRFYTSELHSDKKLL